MRCLRGLFFAVIIRTDAETDGKRNSRSNGCKLIDLGLDAIKSFFAEDHWKRDKAVDIELDRKIKIGATTNSFSIEGGWDQDGKGISIWDQWVNQEHLHMNLTRRDCNIVNIVILMH